LAQNKKNYSDKDIKFSFSDLNFSDIKTKNFEIKNKKIISEKNFLTDEEKIKNFINDLKNTKILDIASKNKNNFSKF